MIRVAILLVCVVLSYAEPQRPGFYIPAQYNQHDFVGPSYVRVMPPLLRPANRFPMMAANTFGRPPYPTFVRLPSLSNSRQFRVPAGAYYLLPANRIHSREDFSINAAHKLFQPMALPLTAGPQTRPAIVATEDDGECQDELADTLPSAYVEEQN